MKKRKRKGNAQNYPAENSVVGSMKWAISGIGGDATRRPRLIVSYEKGTTKIYSLSNVLGEWVVDAKPPTFQNESLAAPLATFLLDPVEGHELGTSPEALADVLEHRNAPEGKWKAEAPPHCLWVAASKKAIRVAVNFNGERVAKVEFEEEELSDVHYITRHGKMLEAPTNLRPSHHCGSHHHRECTLLHRPSPRVHHPHGLVLWLNATTTRQTLLRRPLRRLYRVQWAVGHRAPHHVPLPQTLPSSHRSMFPQDSCPRPTSTSRCLVLWLDVGHSPYRCSSRCSYRRPPPKSSTKTTSSTEETTHHLGRRTGARACRRGTHKTTGYKVPAPQS